MLRVGTFSGEVPRTHPRLLGDSSAQSAVDTRLENGALVPIRKSRLEATVSTAAVTIYRHGGTWLTWDTEVWAAPGPVADERLYITGDGAPKLRVSGVTYPLALSPPSSAPVAALYSDSERLTADGKEFLLIPGRSGSTPHGWKYDVEAVDASAEDDEEDDPGEVTVNMTFPNGASAGRVNSLLNGLKYRNAVASVGAGLRVVSVKSMTNSAGDVEFTCLDSAIAVGGTTDTFTHCTPGSDAGASVALTVTGNLGGDSKARIFVRNVTAGSTLTGVTAGTTSLISTAIRLNEGMGKNDFAAAIADAINANTATTGYRATYGYITLSGTGAQWAVTVFADEGVSHNGTSFGITGSAQINVGSGLTTVTFPDSYVMACSSTFSGGSADAILTSIKIDSVELLTSTISFTSASAVAAAIASQINAATSSPDYTAVAADNVVTIYADDSYEDSVGRSVEVVGGIEITHSETLGDEASIGLSLDWLDPTYASGDPAVALFENSAVTSSTPITAVKLAVSGLRTAYVDPDLSSTVLYSYTWVTTFDEESEPAPLSDDLLWSPGNRVRLTGFATPPSGRAVDRVRIYRSQTSALGETNLYFVAEIDLDDLGSYWIDDPDENEIQEVCPSIDYNPPPDGLRGLIALPNGMMAAFKGRDLYFSEPWIPHAWPEKYMLSTNVDIVGLGAFGSSVAVLTEGTPYVVQGTAPDAMTMERLEVDLPCLASRGIRDMGYAVAYPSTDGLVTISSSGAQVVTASLFTREQWQAMNPSSAISGRHGSRYVLSYSASGRKTLVMDLAGPQAFVVRSSALMLATFFDGETGQMFYRDTHESAWGIFEWDCLSEDREEQTWKSKPFVLPAHTNFGALLIEAEPESGETATVKVYADGVLKATVTKLNEPARLPSGFLARQWELEVSGTAPVTGLTLAMSPAEIAGVS